MQVGQLNKRVTLLKRTITSGKPNPVTSFMPSHTIWANIAWVSDGEKVRADHVQKKTVIRATIRNSKALQIDHSDRMSYSGVEYAIEGIRPIDDEKFLEITLGLIMNNTKRVIA